MYPGGQGCGTHSAPGVRCPGQSEDEYISEFSIWAVAGGQVVFATDPRNMSALQKRILMNTDVLSIFNDTTYFQDIKAFDINASYISTDAVAGADCAVERKISTTECKEGENFGCFTGNQSMFTTHGCRAYFKCDGVDHVKCESNGFDFAVCPCKPAPPPPAIAFLRPLSGNRAAILIHNPNEQPMTSTVEFTDIPVLGWNSKTTVKVRDTWTHSSLPDAMGKFTATVGPHAVSLVIASA